MSPLEEYKQSLIERTDQHPALNETQKERVKAHIRGLWYLSGLVSIQTALDRRDPEYDPQCALDGLCAALDFWESMHRLEHMAGSSAGEIKQIEVGFASIGGSYE